MRGKFLVLEGGDGAGKSSQIALLAEYFRKSVTTSAKVPVKTIHFPRLDVKPYGEMIAAFLRGEYGPIDGVHPRLAALLYALDRQQASPELRETLDQGGIVLADRYIFSNISYQRAKIASQAERDALSDWIEKLEYGYHAIPRADLTLYLDVPIDFAMANLAKNRTGTDREYLKGGRDIHESSSFLQQRVRDEFLRLAKERTGELGVIECRSANGGMADKQTIHSRVIDGLRYYGVI